MKLARVVIGVLLLPAIVRAEVAKPCISSGRHFKLAVEFVASSELKATAVTFVVNYPKAVNLPGTQADPKVRERVHTALSNSTMAANDSESNLRIVVTRAAGVTSGAMAMIDFDVCRSGKPPQIDEFHCQVEAAGSSTGAVSGTSCSLTILP